MIHSPARSHLRGRVAEPNSSKRPQERNAPGFPPKVSVSLAPAAAQPTGTRVNPEVHFQAGRARQSTWGWNGPTPGRCWPPGVRWLTWDRRECSQPHSLAYPAANPILATKGPADPELPGKTSLLAIV